MRPIPINVERRAMPQRAPVLSVANLRTHFGTRQGVVKAVDGVSFDIAPAETVCVVGESGSGKSITARSIMGILQKPGRVVGGSMLFRTKAGETVDLATLPPKGRAYRAIRGGEIGMVFQEPMTALSPVHTIGSQIAEAATIHMGLSRRAARERAAEVLDRVGFPNARARLDAYPFQLSGGMRQRVAIAMALACEPSLLIADEPTTALDVTTQAVILELLAELTATLRMALLFITHDLGVVAEIADDVVVMYLGEVAERGPADTIFATPRHPYTQGLMRCIPETGRKGLLETIPGIVPHPLARPAGCPFNTRCPSRIAGVCERIEPVPTRFPDGATVSCHLYGEGGVGHG
ncbi:ABC transporter ATP-binding protein [Acuticoccus kandeliae]|uniref:ABC transporter ATP-binding protein n=1 Tax=Acuticoccus kandeliae TaxID=2073160 RepID=UPI00196B45BB|nr:ABC transporter ATP-binding protein [Acuticoccus kandeliae]